MENKLKSEALEELAKLKQAKAALKSTLKKTNNQNNNNKIIKIKEDLRELIIAFLDKDRICYLEKEIETMSNIATIDYLEAWLDNDKYSRQRIYSFVNLKYVPEEEVKKFLKTKGLQNENKIQSIEKADEEIERIMAEQKLKYDKMLYHRHKITFDRILSARKFKELGYKHKRSPYKLWKNQKYSYAELNFLDLYTNDELMLYDILYYDQEKNTHKKTIETFKLAYEKYNSILKRLESVTSPTELTATFFNLYKLEKSNHFILKAKVARFLHYNAIDINTVIPDYLTRSFSPLFYIRLPFHKTRPLLGVNLSNQIINYKMIINQAYSEYVTNQTFFKMEKSRITIAYAISLYNYIVPVKTRKSWTEEDFKNTADFLINDYNMFDAFAPLDLSTTNTNIPDFYEYLLRIYNDPCFVTDFEELKKNRDDLKELLEDYKKRKRKQTPKE